MSLRWSECLRTLGRLRCPLDRDPDTVHGHFLQNLNLDPHWRRRCSYFSTHRWCVLVWFCYSLTSGMIPGQPVSDRPSPSMLLCRSLSSSHCPDFHSGGSLKFKLDALGDHVTSCSTHSGTKKTHDWVVEQLADLFCTTMEVTSPRVTRSNNEFRSTMSSGHDVSDSPQKP